MFGKKEAKDKKDKDKKDKLKKGGAGGTSASSLVGLAAAGSASLSSPATPTVQEPIPADCVPVFTQRATQLADLLAWDRKRDGALRVPLLVRRTLDHMFDVGLNTEGLFRVPGNATKMASVEEEFNRGRGVDVDFAKRVSCEDSASLLKKFLRDSLPEELFTSKLADSFRQLMDIHDRKSRKGQFLGLWDQLPAENRAVAYELIHFLVQVAANADLNKMNSENLGTVFGEMAQVPVRDGKHLLKWLIDDWQNVFELDFLAQAKEMTFLRKLIGHYKSVIGMNQFGSYILSTDSGGAVNVWDPTAYTSKKRMKHSQRCYIAPVAVDTSAGQFLWAFFSDACRVWSSRSLKFEDGSATNIQDDADTPIIPVRNVCAATVAGSNVWTVGEKIQIFDANSYALVKDVTDHPAGQDVTLAAGFACGYVWTWRNKTFTAWDPASMSKVKDIGDTSGKPTKFFEVSGHVWVGTESGAIVVLDPINFCVKSVLKQHTATVYCAASVGRLVWTCSWDKSICAWDPATLQLTTKIPNKHTDAISWILPVWKQSYNGWEVWTGSWDRSVHISFVPVHYADQWLPASTLAAPSASADSISPRTLSRNPSQSMSNPNAALAQVMAAAGAPRPMKSPSSNAIQSGNHVRQKSKNDDMPLVPPPVTPISLPPPLVSPRPAGTVPPPMPINIPPPLPSFQHDTSSESERLTSVAQELESSVAAVTQSLEDLRTKIEQAVSSAVLNNSDASSQAYWRSNIEEMHKKELSLLEQLHQTTHRLVLTRQQIRITSISI